MTTTAIEGALSFPAAERQPVPTPHFPAAARVGTRLQSVREELLSVGEHLNPIMEPAGVQLVSDAMRVIRERVCRVAVVGQIKAGKSSFVNALVQQPELLPTDVNPWTTAVTNLNFGQASPDGSAALYNFFNEEEWKRLADGGGKLRELTERLVPGFEHELLQQNLIAVRHRAFARLGDQCHALLGQTHRFESVSAETLRQYVCSGEYPGGQPAATIGKFADITKSADLYLPSGPFDYPVRIIDTPGTNDPFLVRDEITRRSLESADLYIVVLTARQPLSPSDLALLRILRGLHKERIIIFINRIDELRDISRDVSEVVGAVRQRLQIEFPGSNIPVIVGSAWWAISALRNGPFGVESAMERRSLAYLQERGLLKREDLLRPAQEETRTQSWHPALFTGSGIPQIYGALNELMGTSHCAHVMRQVCGCFAELARTTESAARADMQSMGVVHQVTIETTERKRQHVERLRDELRRLQKVAFVVERSASDFEARMKEVLTEDLAHLRGRLTREVDAYAAEERDVLMSILLNGKPPRIWKCDSNALRRKMADEFLAAFHATEARVLDMQRKVLPKLSQLLNQMVANSEATAEPNLSYDAIPAPAMASLSDYVSLDLDQPWWSSWWKAAPSASERGKELEDLIRLEFYAVVEELQRSFEGVIDSHIANTTKWSVGVCNNILQAILRRSEQINTDYANIEAGATSGLETAILLEQQQKVSSLGEKVAKTQALMQSITELSRTMSVAMA